MARILGISAHYHDAAAALVVDGQVVAALQEERLSRLKNDSSLPLRAIRACLELGQVNASELDEVVFYESPFERLERVLVTSLQGLPRGALGLPRLLRAQWESKLWVLDALGESLGIPRRKITTRHHHESHAASAFFTSPFESAAVLTVDGVGEALTTGLFLGEGGTLEFLEGLTFPHSLGLLYAAFTAYLGFEVNEGEHQVMGLAAYGKPRFEEKFAKVVLPQRDGSFELEPEFFDLTGHAEVLFSSRLERVFGPPRSYGRMWGPFIEGSFEDPESQRFADIAASLQFALEKALLGLARRLRAKTGARYLCLAGGVALNAVANARLLREAGFEDIFVHPAAGDAGGALGAALLGALGHGDPRPEPLASVALGLPLRVERAQELGRHMGLRVERVADPVSVAATRIARGEVLAWAQGRSEWGPRALGQRSIVCRADSLELKERVSRSIKRREPFRPFAPAVLATAAQHHFVGRPNSMTPFMTTVCQVKDPSLVGVTHVDGSARLQTVVEGTPFFPLLAELAAQGHAPVVLNTSLNGPGEPIATTEGDVLAFFATSELDALVLGDLIIERPPS